MLTITLKHDVAMGYWGTLSLNGKIVAATGVNQTETAALCDACDMVPAGHAMIRTIAVDGTSKTYRRL